MELSPATGDFRPYGIRTACPSVCGNSARSGIVKKKKKKKKGSLTETSPKPVLDKDLALSALAALGDKKQFVLRRFYYDVALSASPAALPSLLEES